MRAFVLAAGLGTRLRPLTLERPKPAWPLFGVPLAAHLLRSLAGAGATEVVVNLHHLPDALAAALDPWLPPGVRVQWSPEAAILGTGGALSPWRAFLADGPFLLANGDTYQELDLGALVACHRAGGAVATLTLRPVAPGARAPIEVAPDGRVVRFLAARAPGAGAGLPCDFTGVHVLEPEILGRLPAGPHCINADVHQRLVAEGAVLRGYLGPGESFWSDLGTPERYLGAHRELLDRQRVPAGAPGRLVRTDEVAPGGGWVRAPSFLGPGARVEAGAEAGPYAVLGAGAVVGEGARVAGSVLWEGARVGGEALVGAVISPSGAQLVAP